MIGTEFVLSLPSKAMKIVIEDRKNLSFTTSNSSMDRTIETFELTQPVDETRNVIEQTLCATTQLIDEAYLPSEIVITLEHSALVHGPNYTENIPTSLILSRQIPLQNSIRLSLYELENNKAALISILSHEMGHMLMEWIARASKVTNSTHEVIQFWSKPIYEGIADFTSACLTGSTIVGSQNLWLSRDILQYATLQEAQNPKLSMSEVIGLSFTDMGLIPKYQFYRNWLITVEQFLKDSNAKDPYSEGTWVAGQLWKLSDNCKDKKKIWGVLSKFAKSGKPFFDSQVFVQAIREDLYRSQL